MQPAGACVACSVLSSTSGCDHAPLCVGHLLMHPLRCCVIMLCATSPLDLACQAGLLTTHASKDCHLEAYLF